MTTTESVLEERVRASSSPLFAAKRYCLYTPSKRDEGAIIYVIEINGAQSFDDVRSAVTNELRFMRDEDGDLPAGLVANSYYCSFGTKRYVVGGFFAYRAVVRSYEGRLVARRFVNVSLPEDVVLDIIKAAELQKRAVLPIVETADLPSPYLRLLGEITKE